MSSRRFKWLFGVKSTLFFDLERICPVLSIHGIKRACVWHALELKHINTYNILIRHLKWVLEDSNDYLVSKVQYFSIWSVFALF